MIFTVWRWFLGMFQEWCRHDACNVTADLNEGATGSRQLQWCRVCGAVRFVEFDADGGYCRGAWREPNSDFIDIRVP